MVRLSPGIRRSPIAGVRSAKTGINSAKTRRSSASFSAASAFAAACASISSSVRSTRSRRPVSSLTWNRHGRGDGRLAVGVPEEGERARVSASRGAGTLMRVPSGPSAHAQFFGSLPRGPGPTTAPLRAWETGAHWRSGTGVELVAGGLSAVDEAGADCSSRSFARLGIVRGLGRCGAAQLQVPAAPRLSSRLLPGAGQERLVRRARSWRPCRDLNSSPHPPRRLFRVLHSVRSGRSRDALDQLPVSPNDCAAVPVVHPEKFGHLISINLESSLQIVVVKFPRRDPSQRDGPRRAGRQSLSVERLCNRRALFRPSVRSGPKVLGNERVQRKGRLVDVDDDGADDCAGVRVCQCHVECQCHEAEVKGDSAGGVVKSDSVGAYGPRVRRRPDDYSRPSAAFASNTVARRT